MGRKRKCKEWTFPTFPTLTYMAGVDYDYDRYSDEHEHERCDTIICRCSKIDNVRVINININEFVNQLLDGYKHTLFHYATDRLARIHKAYDPAQYEIDVVQGYYGEEIGDITFNKMADLKKDLIAAYAVKDNPTALVQILLTAEYGFVLPRLENFTWELKTVPLKNISPPNDHYAAKVSTDGITFPTNIDLPIAVCEAKGNKFIIVDGYHRYIDAIKQGLKEVAILCGGK